MSEYRVLIVDDQRDVRRVLRAALETLGPSIKVTDVPSGEEAILVISRQPIDLMVADVRLPGISGLELKDRAQVRNPSMRMLLITGLTDNRTRREVETAGVDGYFFKPIDMGSFLSTVESFLNADRPETIPIPKGKDQQAIIAVVPPSKSPDRIPGPADKEPPSLGKEPLKDQVAPPDAFTPPAPPFVIQPGAPPSQTVGLSERLTTLRHDIKAQCALLIDERGQVLAQAGDLPVELSGETTMIQTAAIVGNVTRLSMTLGANLPRGLVYVPASTGDFYFTHIGQNISLTLVTASDSWPENRLGDLLRITRLAARDLLELLAGWGVKVTEEPVMPASPPLDDREPAIEGELEALLPELDAIFQQAESSKLKPQDADAFWESALSDSSEESLRTDGLTYDQARRLGLAPDDN